jgi:hypothetical protein
MLSAANMALSTNKMVLLVDEKALLADSMITDNSML